MRNVNKHGILSLKTKQPQKTRFHYNAKNVTFTVLMTTVDLYFSDFNSAARTPVKLSVFANITEFEKMG